MTCQDVSAREHMFTLAHSVQAYTAQLQFAHVTVCTCVNEHQHVCLFVKVCVCLYYLQLNVWLHSCHVRNVIIFCVELSPWATFRRASVPSQPFHFKKAAPDTQDCVKFMPGSVSPFFFGWGCVA